MRNTFGEKLYDYQLFGHSENIVGVLLLNNKKSSVTDV